MNTLTMYCLACGEKLESHEVGVPGHRGYISTRAVMSAKAADHSIRKHPNSWRLTMDEPKRKGRGKENA